MPKKKVGPRPKPFKCSACDYVAASRVIVAKHFRARHTEFGKYRCKECPYVAFQKSNLDFHVKFTHKAANVAECQMCAYTATSKELLANHVKKVHDKSSHIECMSCDYLAPTETHMKWHMMREHGTTDRMDKARYNEEDTWHPDYDKYDPPDDAEIGFDEDNPGRTLFTTVKTDDGELIKIDASMIDFNESPEEQAEIEAMLNPDMYEAAKGEMPTDRSEMESESDAAATGESPSKLRRSSRKRKPTRAVMEAMRQERLEKRRRQVEEAAAAKAKELAAAQRAETEAAEAAAAVPEIVPITLPAPTETPEQISTYILTDASGDIVATEGVTLTETSDPNQMQFELTTVDDAGNPITFQVATLNPASQEIVTVETPADRPAVPFSVPGGGSREGVKNAYQCNECFKVFKNKRQLSEHESAVHLREKPFGCELCPYRASRKQHIKSHMETHRRRAAAGPRGPHQCNICDYSHAEKFYVESHIKMQHEGHEKVECPHCEFSAVTTYRYVSFFIGN